MDMLESYRPKNVRYLKGDSNATTDSQVVRDNFSEFRKAVIAIAPPDVKPKIEAELELDGIYWLLSTICPNTSAAQKFQCETGECCNCYICEGYLMQYILDKFGLDLDQWLDYPIKFVDFETQYLTTKEGKEWGYPVRVVITTVLADFLDRFEPKLDSVRASTFDALSQDKTHSLWIQDDQCVPIFCLYCTSNVSKIFYLWGKMKNLLQ